MGRKKGVEFSAARSPPITKPPSVVAPPPAPTSQQSVQKMDDSMYMYMLIIGQLMYDKKHLIAERLAADLSLSTMVLASSDALLRIIKKSREIQNMVLPMCEIRSTICTTAGKAKRGRPRGTNHVKQLKIQDLDEIEEIDMTEGDGAASDLSEPDELLEALNDEAPDGATPDGNSHETSELDSIRQGPPNVPRETEDGKIIMMYSPQEKFPCPKPNCKQTFLTRENLDYHLVCSRIHNPMFLKDWGCRYCGREFSALGQVKQHEKTKHEEHDNEVCHECGRQFDSAEKLRRHLDSQHLQKKYRCRDPICPLEFSSESGAKYHYKRVHLNEQITCSVEGCSRKFDRNCDLRRHLDKVHREGGGGATGLASVAASVAQAAATVTSAAGAGTGTPVDVSPFTQAPVVTQPLVHVMNALVTPQGQGQQPQQQPGPAPSVAAPPVAPSTQQALFPSPFTHEDRPFTTMQTVTQQMLLPSVAPVIATSTAMTAPPPPLTSQPQHQQLNADQLQALQSLQYLHHPAAAPPATQLSTQLSSQLTTQLTTQLSTQTHPQFPPPTTDFHGSYMY